jgi:elongator complex protein 5
MIWMLRLSWVLRTGRGRDREGVVLPYFDAQKGGGEGGRILYDMGEEDDFDEEEDEI